MLSAKIRLLLKEIGINLTFSVSGYRSLPKFGLVLSVVTRFCPIPSQSECSLIICDCIFALPEVIRESVEVSFLKSMRYFAIEYPVLLINLLIIN